MFIPPEKAVQSRGEGRRAKLHHALIDADRVPHHQTAGQSKAHQAVTAAIAGPGRQSLYDTAHHFPPPPSIRPAVPQRKPHTLQTSINCRVALLVSSAPPPPPKGN